MGPELERWLQNCLQREQWRHLHIENQATGKTRTCNVKDVVHEPPVELWNVDTMFDRAGKFINYPANLLTIP